MHKAEPTPTLLDEEVGTVLLRQCLHTHKFYVSYGFVWQETFFSCKRIMLSVGKTSSILSSPGCKTGF